MNQKFNLVIKDNKGSKRVTAINLKNERAVRDLINMFIESGGENVRDSLNKVIYGNSFVAYRMISPEDKNVTIVDILNKYGFLVERKFIAIDLTVGEGRVSLINENGIEDSIGSVKSVKFLTSLRDEYTW